VYEVGHKILFGFTRDRLLIEELQLLSLILKQVSETINLEDSLIIEDYPLSLG
jgi:hypothetical protein